MMIAEKGSDLIKETYLMDSLTDQKKENHIEHDTMSDHIVHEDL